MNFFFFFFFFFFGTVEGLHRVVGRLSGAIRVSWPSMHHMKISQVAEGEGHYRW
jgi:hypothetical protein